MRRKTKYLPLGTISHGTLLTTDLFESIVDALRTVRMTRQGRAAVNALRREFAQCADGAKEETLENLWTLADGYAPPYTSLRMSEGDGSDLGVWFDSDAFEYDRRNGEIRDRSATVNGLAYEVSDHGNVTLYSVTNGRARELYGIV